MSRPYEFIAFQIVNDVFGVRLQKLRIEDHELEDVGAELGRLIDEENCRKMVLNLGPEEPECLISIFLAKLINLQRRLESTHGRLALAHASEHTRDLFRLAGIEKYFRFFPDEPSALRALAEVP
jgi:hypothetical protein